MSGNMDHSSVSHALLIESISSLSFRLPKKSQSNKNQEIFLSQVMRLILAACALLEHAFLDEKILQTQLKTDPSEIMSKMWAWTDIIAVILQEEAQKAPDYTSQSENLRWAITLSEMQINMTRENEVLFKLLHNRKALIEMWIQFLWDQQVAQVHLGSIDNSEQIALNAIETSSSLSVSPVPGGGVWQMSESSDGKSWIY